MPSSWHEGFKTLSSPSAVYVCVQEDDSAADTGHDAGKVHTCHTISHVAI